MPQSTRASVVPTADLRRLLAAALGVGLLTGSLSAAALAASPSADAAAGKAGTPQAPVVLFQEDFENGTGTAPVPLTAYVGKTGQKYTADRAWLDNCNGNIVSMRVPVAQLGTCSKALSSASTRQLAYALGVHGGAADPRSNDAVTAHTDGKPGADAIELQTATNIPLPDAKGRFVAFSIDTAAINCRVSAPRYQFAFLDDAGSETKIGEQVDACASGETVDVPAVGSARAGTVRVGTYQSNGSLLFEESALGIRIRNANGSGDGNDAAFDNIRVLDVTPQLDKTFSPSAIATGENSTLTLTVTNTSERAAKKGWSFTDTLPDGLVIADGPATTTCAAGTVDAPAGGTAVRVSGDLAAGMTDCIVSVAVTADGPGRYANGPANIVAIGLNPPDEATLTVHSPGLGLVKHAGLPVDADDDGLTDEGDTIGYTFTLTNTGDVLLTAPTVDDPKAGAVTCPEEPIAPGASVSCTADEPYTVTAADVTAGSVENTATASAAPPSGPRVHSAPSTTRTPVTAAAPSLGLTKDVALDGVAASGQSVTYSFDVTNTGNVVVSDIRIVESAFSGTGDLGVPECPREDLAPSQAMTCSAPYALTQADVDAGIVSNTAVAQGTAPGGDAVASSPSTAELPLHPIPGLSLVKSAAPTPSAGFGVGSEIAYTFVLTNTGSTTLTDVTVVEDEFSGTGTRPEPTCPDTAASLAPGEQVVCSATYAITQADIDAGSITNTAVGSGNPPSAVPVVSTPSTVTIPELASPALALRKTADVTTADRVGAPVRYSFEVTNTGNTTLAGVAIEEDAFSGAAALGQITCPETAATIAPGESVVCHAAYTVVADDLGRETLSNTATATAAAPDGATVESAPSTARVRLPEPSTPASAPALASTGPSVDAATWGAGIALVVAGVALHFLRRKQRG